MTKNKDRSYDFKGFTILVVEDIQLNRKLIKAMLEFTGIQIVEAINGADAITILENLRPDIILMDMMMPVMNGIEATTKIKSNIEFRNIPIVSLTAGVLDEQHEKARIAGCDAFINKPIDVDELLETLQKLLNVKPTFDN